MVAQDVDECLLDRRDNLVAAFDLEGGVEVCQRLVDLIQRIPGRILEHQRAPDGKSLAVHLERVVAVGVVDP